MQWRVCAARRTGVAITVVALFLYSAFLVGSPGQHPPQISLQQQQRKERTESKFAMMLGDQNSEIRNDAPVSANLVVLNFLQNSQPGDLNISFLLDRMSRFPSSSFSTSTPAPAPTSTQTTESPLSSSRPALSTASTIAERERTFQRAKTRDLQKITKLVFAPVLYPHFHWMVVGAPSTDCGCEGDENGRGGVAGVSWMSAGLVRRIVASVQSEFHEDRKGLFLDLGAASGGLSIPVAMVGIRVVAYEPHGVDGALLWDSVMLNSLANVVSFQPSILSSTATNHADTAGIPSPSPSPSPSQGGRQHERKTGTERLFCLQDRNLGAILTETYRVPLVTSALESVGSGSRLADANGDECRLTALTYTVHMLQQHVEMSSTPFVAHISMHAFDSIVSFESLPSVFSVLERFPLQIWLDVSLVSYRAAKRDPAKLLRSYQSFGYDVLFEGASWNEKTAPAFDQHSSIAQFHLFFKEGGFSNYESIA
eukprot:ANDGO_07596.mRNA.1 hypothetical protein